MCAGGRPAASSHPGAHGGGGLPHQLPEDHLLHHWPGPEGACRQVPLLPTSPPLTPGTLWPPSQASTPTLCCPAGPGPPGVTRCHPARKPQARDAPEARPRGHGHDLHVSEGSGGTGVSSRCGPRAGPRSGSLTGVSVVGQGGWRVGRGVTRPLSSPGSRFTGGSCWGGPPALGLCDSGVKTAHCGPPPCPPL